MVNVRHVPGLDVPAVIRPAPTDDVWETAVVGLHWVDPEGTILWANRTELEMLGYRPEEYIGRRIHDFHVDRDRLVGMLGRLKRNEPIRNEEVQMRCKDGRVKTVLVDSSAYIRDGRFVHTRCITRDISAQRHVEGKLRERDALLRLVAESSPALVAYVDQDLRYRFVNGRYQTWFGLDPSALIGRTLPEVLGDEAYEVLRPHAEAALAGEPASFEIDVPYRSGGARHVRGMYIPHRTSDGAPAGFLSVVTDIGPHKRQETESRIFREIFRSSLDGIAYIDPEGRYVEQNAAHLRLLGYTDEDLRDQTPAIHFGQAAFEEIASALAAAGSYRGVLTSRTKGGVVLDVELSASTIRDSSGRVLGHVGIKRDISQRLRDERLLKRRLEHLQAVSEMSQTVARADSLPAVFEAAMTCLRRTLGADRTSILLFDGSGVMRFRAQHGLSQTYQRAVEGHSPWPPDTTDPRPVLVADACGDSAWQAYHELFRSEGIGSLAFVPLTHQGRLLGKFMVYYDGPHAFEDEEVQLAQTIAGNLAFAIHRASAEEELRAAHARLTELDRLKTQFINTVSHELRTPLTPIQLQLDVLQETLRGDASRERSVEILGRNVLRLSGLVHEMVDVSRLQSGRLDVRKTPMDIMGCLRDSVDSYREPARRAGVELVCEAGPGLEVEGDAERLGQVLSNLLSNALKFTPAGGRVVLSAREEGSGVRVSVRDTGPGLTPSQIQMLFQPFSQVHVPDARTRAGTGLGLYICRSLIEAHGGRIWAESEGAGRGTTFVFWLPGLNEAQSARTSPA